MNSPMLTVNGRSYKSPKQPTVVVCVDGCEPDYIAQAVAAGPFDKPAASITCQSL